MSRFEISQIASRVHGHQFLQRGANAAGNEIAVSGATIPGALECRHLLRDHRVAIAQMDRDVGVEQERHPSKACRFGKLFVVALFDGRRTWQRIQKRAIISGMEVAAG